MNEKTIEVALEEKSGGEGGGPSVFELSMTAEQLAGARDREAAQRRGEGLQNIRSS